MVSWLFIVVAGILLIVVWYFQFYRTAGFRFVFQLAIIFFIISYLAFGPYSAYYKQVKDQVKDAGVIAYRAVSGAVTDVWLLATNPTEWYARQQVINVRPEHPVDYPKGVEITLLEAQPPSVPAGQEFELTAVIRNDGTMADPAKDVSVSFGCADACNAGNAAPTSGVPQTISGNQIIYNIKDKMERGEAIPVYVRGFGTNVINGRQAELRIAKVLFNLSYTYSTSSSLLTDVMNQVEITRRTRNNEDVFRSVVAVAKSSPARLSLNVGPQPLIAGQEKILLLVSVSNTRDDGNIILKKGNQIKITMPKSVGSQLDCGSNAAKTTDDQEKEIITYTIPGDITILSYDFHSIFSFICTFTASKDVETVKTGLVTAEMPEYRFVLMKKKDVPVTPPIGIIFDPYAKKCNAASTEQKCHDVSDSDPTRGTNNCYYDPLVSGVYGLGAAERAVANTCFSCGVKPACSQFEQYACEKEALPRCNVACKWETDKCVETTPPVTPLQGGVVQRIIQAAQRMKPPGADAQVRAEGIANTFEDMVLKLAYSESTYRQCRDGTLNCVNDNTYGSVLCSVVRGTTNSCGVMQISIVAHPLWKDSTTDHGCGGKGAYDLDCNIQLGIGLLIDEHDNWGASGNSAPACSDEPYRTKYISYTGWKAALRAYNGWGCPTDYPGGQDKAGNYIENLIRIDVEKIKRESAGTNFVVSFDPASPTATDTITFTFGISPQIPAGASVRLNVDGSPCGNVCSAPSVTCDCDYSSLTRGTHTYNVELYPSGSTRPSQSTPVKTFTVS